MQNRIILQIRILRFSVKPTLKRVAKHENKFAKLQSQAAKYQFRNQLKTVKKQEYTLKGEDEGVR